MNGEFTVKVLEREPVVRLVPRNCRYSPIVIHEGDDFEIFGVVTNVIRTMKTPMKCFALVDRNNFYASCEKLFRPDLKHTPVVVLSNTPMAALLHVLREVKQPSIKMYVLFCYSTKLPRMDRSFPAPIRAVC